MFYGSGTADISSASPLPQWCHGRHLESVTSYQEIRPRQSMPIYLKNNTAKFHSDLICDDWALGIFWGRVYRSFDRQTWLGYCGAPNMYNLNISDQIARPEYVTNLIIRLALHLLVYRDLSYCVVESWAIISLNGLRNTCHEFKKKTEKLRRWR